MRSLPIASLSVLALLGCERGHYETRDHAVPEETAGGEPAASTGAESEAETAAASETAAVTEAGAVIEADASLEVGSGAEPDQGAGDAAHDDASAHAQSDERMGHAPEEEMQRARAEAGPVVTFTVHSATGPVTLAVARRVVLLQHARVDHCYRLLLGDGEAAGTIRAVLTVEASGAVAAELETMAPALDRAVPCIDAALEHAQFPAATDGRRSHVILQVSLAPRR